MPKSAFFMANLHSVAVAPATGTIEPAASVMHRRPMARM